MSRSRSALRKSVAAGIVAAVAASATAALAHPATAAVKPHDLGITLPSVQPGWARLLPVSGPTPATANVALTLTLQGKDVAGMLAYGQAASTPGNANYRHWLTVDDYKARYSPDASALAAVTGALKTLGVTSITTDAIGQSVLIQVPASLATAIFGVTFHQVLRNGVSTRVAEQSTPTLPESLKPYVTNVSGFTENIMHTDHTAEVPVPDAELPVGQGTAYFNAGPKSTYYGQLASSTKGLPAAAQLSGDSTTDKPFIVGGYTGTQVRGAYDADKTKYSGKGVTVGVVLWYDGLDVDSDLQTYSTENGLPFVEGTTYTDDAVAPGSGSTPATSDAVGEQQLDVEAIHAMAPDAKIVYSGAAAPVDQDLFMAESDAFEKYGAEVVNNSWGGSGEDPSSEASFATNDTGPAATMGVGIDFSSGDAADNVAAGNGREADFPATSDGVTAVGGTGLEIGKNNDYQGEFYWGTYSASLSADGTSWGPFAAQSGGAGGGGGLSADYAEPSWQKGVVPDEETTNTDTAADYKTSQGSAATYGVPGSPGRVVPDVAMIADSTTGFLVGQTQTPDMTVTAGVGAANVTSTYSHYRIGGTSVSSPIFTGLMAQVDEALGKGAGFINPTIYSFNAKHDGSFRDPQIGRAATASRLGSTEAQVLGTPNKDGSIPAPGNGVVPVVSEVRPDYTDTANDGLGTCVTDPTGVVPVPVSSPVCTAGGNTVTYHLRGEGVLGTLEDLPGYDDSTGLGSPDAPQFIADFLAAGSAAPAPALPDAPYPVLFALVAMAVVGCGVLVRRRVA